MFRTFKLIGAELVISAEDSVQILTKFGMHGISCKGFHSYKKLGDLSLSGVKLGKQISNLENIILWYNIDYG